MTSVNPILEGAHQSETESYEVRNFVLALSFAVLVFAPALQAGFLADDFWFLWAGQELRDLSIWERAWWEQLQAPWSALGYFRPFITLVWGLNAWLGGANATTYAATNVLLHLCNGALVYGLARAVWSSPRSGLAAALIFWFHPIAHEPVTWLAARVDLVVTLSVLGALLALWRGWQPGAPRGWYAVALGSALVALLSKEIAAVLPLLAWLLALRRWDSLPWPARLRRAAWAVLPLLGLLALWAVVRFWVVPLRSETFDLRPTVLLWRLVVVTPHRLLWGLPRPWFYMAMVGLSSAIWHWRAVAPRTGWLLAGGWIAGCLPFILTHPLFPGEGVWLGARLLYLPSVGLALAVGHLFALASARHALPLLLALLASSIIELTNAMRPWLVASRTAERVIVRALEREPAICAAEFVQIAGLPRQWGSAYFFPVRTQGETALHLACRHTAVRPVTPTPAVQLIWDNTIEELRPE